MTINLYVVYGSFPYNGKVWPENPKTLTIWPLQKKCLQISATKDALYSP
jgi:hypothetical protein